MRTTSVCQPASLNPKALNHRGLEDHMTPSIVRGDGHDGAERSLEQLSHTAKTSHLEGLVTYVNNPTTGSLSFLDLLYCNIHLETQNRLEAYLSRLYHLGV